MSLDVGGEGSHRSGSSRPIHPPPTPASLPLPPDIASCLPSHPRALLGACPHHPAPLGWSPGLFAGLQPHLVTCRLARYPQHRFPLP